MISGEYDKHFHTLTKFWPYDYQRQVAKFLFEGRNVIVRAPTGAGKTWAVLAPFFCDAWQAKPSRLIYALPLRSLALGIYNQALKAAGERGKPTESVVDEKGHEVVAPFVTLQTGSQPEDPFFDRGHIIVTTYDQVLSGLLCGPYGLSERLHNINAAAITGALVVFDEFHLMPAAKAFLTGASALALFKELCQSVWMSATATSSYEKVLDSALGTVTVPGNPQDTAQMMASLPRVSRTFIYETEPLTAAAIKKHHQRRSIVMVNTVRRAQAIFEELRALLVDDPGIHVILLHSRFFKQDRKEIEAQLENLLGRKPGESVILIATQVIEAGIDISCEQLHTELCPMNSIAQRAGRCARFDGETGTVHVYPLPAEPGAWLPYGDPAHEDEVLAQTRALLSRTESCQLAPTVIAKWVESVHASDDAQALRLGWTRRRTEIANLIFQNAILRSSVAIAHLIRGNDSQSLGVIIADGAKPPDRPGLREAISISRWSLAPLLTSGNSPGWYWDGDETTPWKPLTTPAQLALTYAICLRLEFADYNSQFGLRLGRPGTFPSPPRDESKRPGHNPLREESWLNHARMVAEAAQHRLKDEGFPTSLSAVGFAKRYRLLPQHLMLAARFCGLLHDLGKLQGRWQEWALAMQRSKHPGYQPSAALAHTDFDPDDPADRARERSIGISRPGHAICSAYYCILFLESAFALVPEQVRAPLASASLAAILAHHGAFVPKTPAMDLDILPFIKEWGSLVPEALECTFDSAGARALAELRDKKGYLKKCLDASTGRDKVELWWPLAAYLIRTLRLSDQRATSEWACG